MMRVPILTLRHEGLSALKLLNILSQTSVLSCSEAFSHSLSGRVKIAIAMNNAVSIFISFPLSEYGLTTEELIYIPEVFYYIHVHVPFAIAGHFFQDTFRTLAPPDGGYLNPPWYRTCMYVKVLVRAAAKKESLKMISPDHFEISVKEKPAQNLANRRIVAIIADHFHVSSGKVRIINGHRSPSKLLAVG
ncbi:MAG: DUF167 family protein [Minisyncoccia bacterium]